VVWLFSLLALVLVVGIALVVVGGETARLADAARPAVMELYEAVDYEDEVEEEGIDDDLPLVIDEVDAIARILVAADRSGRDVDDEDVAAVLAGRTDYLQAIGAVGPEAR
jgi:hypothetical protein